jgi:hypothetical protein
VELIDELKNVQVFHGQAFWSIVFCVMDAMGLDSEEKNDVFKEFRHKDVASRQKLLLALTKMLGETLERLEVES